MSGPCWPVFGVQELRVYRRVEDFNRTNRRHHRRLEDERNANCIRADDSSVD